MKEFRKMSHSMCGIIWLAALGCLACLLFLCPLIREKWMTGLMAVAAVLSLVWAVWSTASPPGD